MSSCHSRQGAGSAGLHIVEEPDHLVAELAGCHRLDADVDLLAAHDARPELVLADICLADGSSGIDAVHDIFADMDVPVIFVTAFPERLLTGERPEPTYLITKPFDAAVLTATMAQALLFHREAQAIARNRAAA